MNTAATGIAMRMISARRLKARPWGENRRRGARASPVLCCAMSSVLVEARSVL